MKCRNPAKADELDGELDRPEHEACRGGLKCGGTDSYAHFRTYFDDDRAGLKAIGEATATTGAYSPRALLCPRREHISPPVSAKSYKAQAVQVIYNSN